MMHKRDSGHGQSCSVTEPEVTDRLVHLLILKHIKMLPSVYRLTSRPPLHLAPMSDAPHDTFGSLRTYKNGKICFTVL